MQDSKRDTDVKNRLLDFVGEGESGRIWENTIEMCIIICETNRQSRFYAWGRVLRAGALGWPWGMGWGRRWKGVQDGEHMYTHGSFMSMYGKTHHNTVKELASNLKFF